MTLWRQDETGEWVECGPYCPPRGTLVLDPARSAHLCELGKLRAAALAIVPSIYATAKKEAKDRERGQQNVFDLLMQKAG